MFRIKNRTLRLSTGSLKISRFQSVNSSTYYRHRWRSIAMLVLVFASVLIHVNSLMGQSVGLNNATPDASSILDLTATDRGLLVPRMTTTQRTTGIASPATGLLVFDTDLGDFYFYDGTGWKPVGSSGANWTRSGNYVYNTTDSIGIGTSTPGKRLEVVGDIKQNNTQNHSMIRSLPTVISDYIELGYATLSGINGGFLQISITLGSSWPVIKSYLIPIAYNQTSGNWQTVIPTNVSHYSAGVSQDFDLEIRVNTNTAYLRLRRTAGTSALTAHILIQQDGQTSDSFTLTSATGSATPPAAFFTGTAVTTVGLANTTGYVGIGMLAPAEQLDVAGTVEMTGFKLTTAPTLGDVLVADAAGVGTWTDPTTISDGDWTVSGSDMYSAVSGNVGIGQISPTYKLDMRGTGTISQLYFRAVTSGGINQFKVESNAAGSAFLLLAQTAGTTMIQLHSSGISYFTGGDVGIGVTIPDGKLEVRQTLTGDIFNLYDGSTNVFTVIDGGNVGIGGVSVPSEALVVAGTTEMTGFKLTTSPAAGYVLATDASGVGTWADPATLPGGNWTRSGNYVYNTTDSVGIGTTSPPAKLTVQGASSTASIPGTASTGVFRVGIAGNEGLDFGKNDLSPYNAWIQVGFDGTTADPLALQPSGGNVGIGITDPTQKLDVAGTAQMTGFKLTTAPTLGYVLTSDASGVGSWTDPTTISDGDWTVSGSNMYSAVSGNVGIGIATPVRKLDVDFGFADAIVRVMRQGITAGNLAGFEFGAYNLIGDQPKAAIYFYDNYTYARGDMYFALNYAADYSTSVGPTDVKMMIQASTGNVGIGTTSPTESLEVVGHAIATPITGVWHDASGTSSTAAEFLRWDSEELNTNSAYLGYVSGRDYIEIIVAGYYSISVSILKNDVALDESTSIDIRRYNSANSLVETINILFTEGAGSSFVHLSGTIIEFFNANDRLKVYDAIGIGV